MKPILKPILLSIVLHLVFLLMLSDGQLQAQGNVPFLSPSPLLQSSTAAATSPSFSMATQVMIGNRFRTLGDKVSGSGTRYFAVSDYDLRGLTPEKVLQKLSPAPVAPGDGVRKLEILIDLRQPLRLETRPGQSVDIGTAVIGAGAFRRVEVNTSIFSADLTVVAK